MTDSGNLAEPADIGTGSGGPLVVLENVNKWFGPLHVLKDINLTVHRGEVVVVIGPSGGGKSTLCRTINRLEPIDGGTITLDGKHLPEEGKELARLRADVGMVFQSFNLFAHKSVLENVTLGPIKVRRVGKADAAKEAMAGLERVGIADQAQKYPAQLSGGQRQRMALARALAVDPKVLLLDEPFGALDAKVRADLRAWLRRLHDEVHVTTVLVTHDQEEALDVADRIAVLHQGRIEQVGSPDDLYDRPANEFVMSFLGSVSRLGGRLVRPHDIVLERSTGSDRAGLRATVLRIVRLGFEVRVELKDDSGAEFTAQLTRGDVDALSLHEGDLVVASTIRASPLEVTPPADEPAERRHDVDDDAPVAVAG